MLQVYLTLRLILLALPLDELFEGDEIRDGRFQPTAVMEKKLMLPKI